MNIDLLKTLKQIEKKLTPIESVSASDLHKAYDIVIRLRSQLLSVIHDFETFDALSIDAPLAELLTSGLIETGSAVLTINEPLPPTKELTSAVEDHWLELVHTAIDKAAKGKNSCVFKKPSSGSRSLRRNTLTMPSCGTHPTGLSI